MLLGQFDMIFMIGQFSISTTGIGDRIISSFALLNIKQPMSLKTTFIWCWISKLLLVVARVWLSVTFKSHSNHVERESQPLTSVDIPVNIKNEGKAHTWHNKDFSYYSHPDWVVGGVLSARRHKRQQGDVTWMLNFCSCHSGDSLARREEKAHEGTNIKM